jgi:hypothetical protein
MRAQRVQAVAKMRPSQAHHRRVTMLNKLIQRSVSIAMAAVLTPSMLGGIDSLSQPEAGAAQWAQQAASATRG